MPTFSGPDGSGPLNHHFHTINSVHLAKHTALGDPTKEHHARQRAY